MDASLLLVIPELKPLDKLERHQAIFTWDEKDYPQEPVTYHWGPHVELITSRLKPSLLRFFPAGYLPSGYLDEQCLVLDVGDEALNLLEREVNGEEVDWFGYRLEDLLKRLLNQHEKWAVIFELHYDQIDYVVRLSTDECIEKLKTNLKHTIEREGFVVLAEVPRHE